MAEVDAEQRRAAAWVISAARRMVPSPPITTASSQPCAGVGVAVDDLDRRIVRAGSSSRSAASAASSRTTMPWPVSALQNARRDVAGVRRARCGRAAAPGGRRRRVGSVTGQPSHPAPPGGGQRPHDGVDVVRARSSPGPAAATGRTPRCRTAPAAGWPSPPGRPSPRRPRRRRPRHRLGPQRGVADHAALADPVLADLELRLDHQHQVAVGAGHREQRRRAPAPAR